MEIWEAILSGAAVASLCNGIFTIVQMELRRRWEKSEKESAQVHYALDPDSNGKRTYYGR